MGWESSVVVRFDLGLLLQGQTRIVKPKSAYNSLIIRAGTGAEKRHRVLTLSQPARIRVTARFSIYH